jgi:hypothetical protein
LTDNNYYHASKIVADPDLQVYGASERQKKCAAILDGLAGEYHIFGAAFEVGIHTTAKFPLLILRGVLPGCSLATIRRGTWIPTNRISFDLERMTWKSEEERLFISFLRIQPEMVKAVEERNLAIAATRARKIAMHTKNNADEFLKQALFLQKSAPVENKTEKKRPPKLKNLSDLLTATWGTYVHKDVTFLVSYVARQGSGKRGRLAVTVQNIPDNHFLTDVFKNNIFVFQDSLQNDFNGEMKPPATVQTGNSILAAKLRTYLQGEFNSHDVHSNIEDQAMDSEVNMQNVDVTQSRALQEIRSNQGMTAKKPRHNQNGNSMRRTSKEHARALGTGQKNLH